MIDIVLTIGTFLLELGIPLWMLFQIRWNRYAKLWSVPFGATSTLLLAYLYIAIDGIVRGSPFQLAIFVMGAAVYVAVTVVMIGFSKALPKPHGVWARAGVGAAIVAVFFGGWILHLTFGVQF